MKLKRKEIFFAIFLSTLAVLPALYLDTGNEGYFSMLQWDGANTRSNANYLSQVSQQRSELISENIEGELDRGTFEDTINKLEILVYEKEGYVKSLRLTYQSEYWSGYILCKIPPTRVTSFTFGARALIDANGTVTYININVEYVDTPQQGQGDLNATININLKEAQSANAAGIAALLSPVLSVLATSLFWIAQGLVVSVPLCFASLGVVILVNRGIIPVWKNTLRKTRMKMKEEST